MSVNKKRLEYQLYLARENPEPTFDISKCDITKIPQGCYALCKVLRKKILNINNNKIKDLSSNGNLIEDLTVLTHIYAGYNEIDKLPDNINSIKYLQILDLSNNQLRLLPSSIGDLQYLRILYLQNNFIHVLPSRMLTSQSALELIDISENREFNAIPFSILQLKKLRSFSCTTKYLTYPSQEVCQRGIIEIMKIICRDAGVKCTNDIFQRFCGDVECDDVDFNLVDSSVLDYESFKQSRLNFLKSIESELNKDTCCQLDIRNKALKERTELLEKIANEEVRITKEITLLHLERDLRREQLINDVKEAEADAKNLIEEIMTVNQVCRQQEKILDELEKDAIKQYRVYQEDYNKLRKEEILDIMSQMLASKNSTKQFMLDQLTSKENLNEKMTRSKSLTDESISELLKDHRIKRNNLCSEIAKQENHQKSAFQNLQLEKDIRTLRIKKQISSVESELMILSQVEQNKRTEKNFFELKILNLRRAELVKLLENLKEEKYLREKDLMARLMEIEKQRKDNNVDFWLVQYQRLLDMKPPDISECSDLDVLVLEAINRADAREYLPFLQRRNITWEQLTRFQERDLENIGIHNASKIKDVLDAVAQLKEHLEKKTNSCINSLSIALIPAKSTAVTLTSHKESECCICLVEETTILFLECAHICCCENCSKNLLDCPLCRQPISRLIKLTG